MTIHRSGCWLLFSLGGTDFYHVMLVVPEAIKTDRLTAEIDVVLQLLQGEASLN
tara:strand:- start:237 stop:398 length:162 start_codon:yes stop_codon:yes gene_type:complete